MVRPLELDVAGIDADYRLNLVGECKWSHKKVGVSVYQQLQDKLHHKLPLAPNCRFLLYSSHRIFAHADLVGQIACRTRRGLPGNISSYLEDLDIVVFRLFLYYIFEPGGSDIADTACHRSPQL